MKFHSMQDSLSTTCSPSTQVLLYYKPRNQFKHSHTASFSKHNHNTQGPVFFLSVQDASSCNLLRIKPSSRNSRHPYAGQLMSAAFLPPASSEGEFSLDFWQLLRLTRYQIFTKFRKYLTLYIAFHVVLCLFFNWPLG